MSAADAMHAARREFGPVELRKEECRDARAISFLEDLLRDLMYAFRLLKRSPGFTAAAVVSLALGIGANTAIFSLVDAVLLQMLPVRNPQQLMEISRQGGKSLSYPIFEAIRDRNQVFSGVLLLSAGRLAAGVRSDNADLGEIHVGQVSGDFFHVLGVSPMTGRMLSKEDLPSSGVAVISYGFWQHAFAGNPTVLGKALRLGAETQTYTIVGVAAEHFTGVTPGQPVDMWIPITPSRNPVAFMFRIMARRKPGVSEATALANVRSLARELGKEWGFEQPLPIEAQDAGGGLTQLRRRFARPLLVLMFVSALLLLMVALNLGSLLFARASARQHEIGVRLSLGAGRARLIRQLLTECFVLGIVGSGLGILLAPIVTRFLTRYLSLSTGTVELPFAIDLRMLSFTVFVSVAAILLFGVAPALASTRLNITPMFTGSAGSGRSTSTARRGRLLVAVQVAISCVLLAGSALFGRSFVALAKVDAGFNPENVLLLHLGTAKEGPSGLNRVRLYNRVLQRISAVPGVRSAAMSSESLFSGSTWTEDVSAPGFTQQRGVDRQSVLLAVSPAFFKTMRIPLIRGRDFGTRDNETAPKVAVVNEAMARFYFGSSDPIGRTFRLETSDFPTPITVVGVTPNVKYRSLKEANVRMIFLPALQAPGPFEGTNIEVRTPGNPEKMAGVLWNVAKAESPYLRFEGFTTQQELVSGTITQDRMLAEIAGFFGIFASILVCLGLYGLTAYQVSRRTAEIGLRIALGAQRRDVLLMVLKSSMVLVAAGSALGLCVAFALARTVQSLLFNVHAMDIVTLITTPALLVSIGAAAAYWPARRAAQLDPKEALRYQ